ncbi:MAG: sigma-70 family RNA polymerase sigma factor [Burkholderiaceae bacterium]
MAESSFGASDLEAVVPRLRRYARALTGNREAADDLTQDTLERAWSKRVLWQPGTDLRAWMFTVMHNVFVNGTRRSRPTVSLDDLVVEDVGAATATSVETGVVLAELARALSLLPEEQREVLLLVGLEQFSYAEASEVLGVPMGTVMSRLSRGRERLRILMEAGTAGADRPSPLRRVK